MLREVVNRISINAHSSIAIDGEAKVYVDPYLVKEAANDADVIFITHDHFDHLSKDDFMKLIKEDTIFVIPESCAGSAAKAGIPKTHIRTMNAGDELELPGVCAFAVPAYNIGKPFHPKENGWLGYVLTIDEVRIYIAGDTDVTEDAKAVECDIAMIPAGGTYTTDAKQAAELANAIAPKVAIPTHYGADVGKMKDGDIFAKNVDKGIEVVKLIK
jgi:L-ascorbate metabolism protein UlaG (beta-lactamase superfamily)